MGTGVAGVPMRELALVILVAAAFTYLLTGIVRHYMVKTGRVGEIRERDAHTQPKPRLGGIAMFAGFLAAIFLANQLPALTRGFQPITPEMSAVVSGAVVIVVVGVIDDLWDLDALTKLIGQILGAAVMSFMGLTWTLLYVPFGDGTTLLLDQTVSTIVTVIFTVTVINAINFVDGLDGLAAGLGMIAAASILIFSMTVLHDQGGMVSAYPPAIIAAALVGMCAGFLPHNFEPARIFMGDSGAMLIGFLLAAASTSASGKINMSLYGTADMVALLSPIIVVAAAISVPMLDLVMAVVRRVSKGQSPFAADKMHLHHRLLSLGHTHRRVALVLYLWVSAVAFGAVAFSVVPAKVAVAGTVVAFILAALATRGPARRARAQSGAHKSTVIEQAPPE
ncbi:MraY family glycosyltransferase [Corynebacterium sp. SCR221107]|uniref:MraY family glycosyltransferase n=1 Tax=Corynebacterium sp. SCR221107 TaxID=3017361 RepID=UPI0022EC5986|nr:MraY family glycosyltransferase [Corynebacterium sp. SCR221107]WBT09793.1 MraY family glycosyltransferase [Corynebacterium sp. SCR221107]